jgi:hypothetical protein
LGKLGQQDERLQMLNPTPETRKWIYGVIAAIVPLLVAIGILSEELASPLLNVFAALLTIGGSALAISNVPSDND